MNNLSQFMCLYLLFVAITVRDKLESLCRELQRQNKVLMVFYILYLFHMQIWTYFDLYLMVVSCGLSIWILFPSHWHFFLSKPTFIFGWIFFLVNAFNLIANHSRCGNNSFEAYLWIYALWFVSRAHVPNHSSSHHSCHI